MVASPPKQDNDKYYVARATSLKHEHPGLHIAIETPCSNQKPIYITAAMF